MTKTLHIYLGLIIGLGVVSCQQPAVERSSEAKDTLTLHQPSLIVLGNVQDAGSPHIACKKSCCIELFKNPDSRRKAVSLGIVDPENLKYYLMEATPDISTQLKALKAFIPQHPAEIPDGIFLTHAHIGHYTGLMYLGKEAIDAQKANVYAMPTMGTFLTNNGPWSQLVSNQNIVLHGLYDQTNVKLTSNISITPMLVPHRDEYSETVGYKIFGPHKTALFIPDIDKWNKWRFDIIEEIQKVDYAFIDATFYDSAEINNRDISEIPHPFVSESMKLFKDLPATEKRKIWFIHMNHTNPLLNPESEQSKLVLSSGFNIARYQDVFGL